MTFAVRYGITGARINYYALYPIGILLFTFALWSIASFTSALFFLIALIVGIFVAIKITALKGLPSEYHFVMRLKYTAGLSFSLFAAAVLLLQSLRKI